VKNPIKAAKDRAQRKGAQRRIMGKKSTHRQEREQLAAENRTRRDPTAQARVAVKRVGEYKQAKARKMAKADGTSPYLNRRKQENLK